MKFYTSAVRYGNNILYRGYDNGRQIKKSYAFKPTMYVTSQTSKTGWTSLTGQPLEPMYFESMRDAGEFVRQYKDIPNFEVHGMSNYVAQFLRSLFPNDIQYDPSIIKIAYIDIEVASDDGFPEPEDANHPVISICMRMSDSDIYHVWGLMDYDVHRDDVKYYKCAGESDLLLQFIEFWRKESPEVVTGWNSKLFDMTYLINRVCKKIGQDSAKKFSPWGVYQERNVKANGRSQQSYEIYGCEHLDYYDLFIKFGTLEYGMQESYKLDFIANLVLNESKLSYEEHGNLHTLYKEDHQKFIDYNIRDVELIYRFEEAIGLIKLAMTIAYKAGTNYSDAFGTTSLWDTYIYRSLNDKGMAVPPKKENHKEIFAGGYVKTPQVGRHEWVVSFDLNSLYPHLIMQYNMSPETILDVCTDGVTIQNCIDGNRPNSIMPEASMAANGVHFSNEKRGVIPAIIDDLYAERSTIKKNMLKVEQEVQHGAKQKISEVAKLNAQQMAIKIMMNSLYGAMGNCWFRYYDLRLAEGITLSGQLSILWAERAVNNYMNKLLKTKDVDYVIAIDTDSVYINFGPLVDKSVPDKSDKKGIVRALSSIAENNFEPVIAAAYEDLAKYMHAYENRMTMNREVIADVGIWTAKKRYILNVHDNEGVQYPEPKLKILGIEAVKSSTPESCRDALKELFKVIVNGTEVDVQNYISAFRDKFEELPAHDVAFPRGVGKVVEYSNSTTIYSKGAPIQSRASLLYNFHIKKNGLTKRYSEIRNGEKIKFVYLKEPNPIRENVIGFPDYLPKELKLDTYVDYATQFDKAFLSAVEPVLSAIGWSSKASATLDAFFG